VKRSHSAAILVALCATYAIVCAITAAGSLTSPDSEVYLSFSPIVPAGYPAFLRLVGDRRAIVVRRRARHGPRLPRRRDSGLSSSLTFSGAVIAAAGEVDRVLVGEACDGEHEVQADDSECSTDGRKATAVCRPGPPCSASAIPPERRGRCRDQLNGLTSTCCRPSGPKTAIARRPSPASVPSRGRARCRRNCSVTVRARLE
jgi:hypothetical protein